LPVPKNPKRMSDPQRYRSAVVTPAAGPADPTDGPRAPVGRARRRPLGVDGGRYDWLKKPFSISCARSSAEIETLAGVSMKTLSAMRCMPPSSA
jgi:hypothetical protein